jgi:hypothetical protein
LGSANLAIKDRKYKWDSPLFLIPARDGEQKTGR